MGIPPKRAREEYVRRRARGRIRTHAHAGALGVHTLHTLYSPTPARLCAVQGTLNTVPCTLNTDHPKALLSPPASVSASENACTHSVSQTAWLPPGFMTCCGLMALSGGSTNTRGSVPPVKLLSR